MRIMNGEELNMRHGMTRIWHGLGSNFGLRLDNLYWFLNSPLFARESATMEVAPFTMPAKGTKSETAPRIFDVTLSPLHSDSFHSTFFKRSSLPASYDTFSKSRHNDKFLFTLLIRSCHSY